MKGFMIILVFDLHSFLHPFRTLQQISKQNFMFQQFENDHKFQRLAFERTAPNFAQTPHDQSFVSEIQAEKEYVQRLKLQREKIQTLYSKYDILLKELKSKDTLIKEKDRTIITLQTKFKGLVETNQEVSLFKQQNHAIKSENHTLQKAINELEQSYNYLHGQLRTKQAVTQQKYQEVELLNDELIAKVRSLSKILAQKQQEFTEKSKDLSMKWQQSKLQLKRQKQNTFHEVQSLKQALFDREEDCTLLRMDNSCLKQRVIELETFINERTFEYEQKIQTIQKQRKIQIRTIKSEMDNIKEINLSLEKKLAKTKDQNQLKELSLTELSIALEKQDKQFNEILFRLRKQSGEERAILKQQLVQCQNHIAKIERKLLQGQRKQQCLYGKIKKYEVCLDAKRNLRQVQKQQLEKITLLLSHP